VTALHCVVESLDVQSFEDLVVVPAEKTFVIVGDHNLNDRDETDITKIFKAAEIVIAKSGDDIAMIKVDGVLDTNVYTPICLPDKDDDFRGMTTVVTGWGRNVSSTSEEEATTAEILQEIELPLATADKCEEIINGTFDGILCFGDGEEGKGGCFGDSGGPLIVQKPGETSWNLAGLVSAGTMERCASKDTFGIAVEIAHLLGFIRTTASDGEFCPK